jgi:hypothetical protein
LNCARRQQYRRRPRAGTAAGSVAAAVLAFVTASVGAISLTGLLFFTAVGLGLYSRYWLGLARRSRVGAQSETVVRRVLAGRMHYNITHLDERPAVLCRFCVQRGRAADQPLG